MGPPNLDSGKGRGPEWASRRAWCLTEAGESVGNDLGTIAETRKDGPGRGASMCKGLLCHEHRLGVKSDFSNFSSSTHWLCVSGQVVLGFWPELPICKIEANHIYLKGMWSIRVRGAYQRFLFPLGNSHSCSSCDCPGVKTRCFSFGNLFSYAVCSLGPQHLFLEILTMTWVMLWTSWNLLLKKDLRPLTIHLNVSQQGMMSGT